MEGEDRIGLPPRPQSIDIAMATGDKKGSQVVSYLKELRPARRSRKKINMFRRLDALLGKNFKTSKFKKLINLAISRIASLNNRYQVRCSHARSDVITLLKFGHQEQCPDELKEAISSLLFAASRCGELPELQKIRGVLTSRFGKRFASCAVELRNDCGVNPKIVKKLSTRRPSLGSKLKALKEIAPINEITEGQSSVINEEKLDFCQEQKQPEPKN
ncbi:hypothetical protein L1049_003203 [Liquidambar formosana]|uniref:Uncharacterized protein n=1 Tax=Liquidambar formosana TaxID=63359 RepID=A0AAP0NJR8_LIQFO